MGDYWKDLLSWKLTGYEGLRCEGKSFTHNYDGSAIAICTNVISSAIPAVDMKGTTATNAIDGINQDQPEAYYGNEDNLELVNSFQLQFKEYANHYKVCWYVGFDCKTDTYPARQFFEAAKCFSPPSSYGSYLVTRNTLPC